MLASLIVLGVDVGDDARAIPPGVFASTAERLLDRLRRYQFQATWGFRSLDMPLVRQVQGSMLGQEIALELTTADAPRSIDCFSLAARLRECRRDAESAGMILDSLVYERPDRASMAAIAQAGFRTLRSSGRPARRLIHPVNPQRLRHGLWNLPVSFRWPHPHRITQQWASRQVAFSLRRTARLGAVLHLVFDLPELCRQQAAALAGIDRLLETAAQIRGLGLLRSARLVDVHRLAQADTTSRPTQSILRYTG
jgi:hypothetical protein